METPEVNSLIPPDLIYFSGDWPKYEEELYRVFLDTLIKNTVLFQGLPVRLIRHPEYKNKHFAFWHLTSEGEKEGERTPDLRRCERLPWVSWVILNCDKTKEISYRENRRKSQRHIVIWYETYSYAVVLAKRKNYFLLKTAYLATSHRAKIFRSEKSKFMKRKV